MLVKVINVRKADQWSANYLLFASLKKVELLLLMFFSYASSSTLYPCQWVTGSLGHWAEFRTSVALRLASLLGMQQEHSTFHTIEGNFWSPPVAPWTYPVIVTCYRLLLIFPGRTSVLLFFFKARIKCPFYWQYCQDVSSRYPKIRKKSEDTQKIPERNTATNFTVCVWLSWWSFLYFCCVKSKLQL